MRRGVFGIAAVLAVVGVALFVLLSGPGSDDELLLGDGGSSRSEAASKAPPPDTPRSEIHLPAQPVPVQVRKLNEESGVLTEAEAAEGCLVRVVHADTKRPVPGAIVFLKTARTPPDDERIGGLVKGGGPLARLLAAARKFRAGRDGSVRVPWPEEESIIGARMGSAGTLRQMMPGRVDTLTLEITPSRRGLVRVIDLEGKPVPGVPVALRLKDGRHLALDWWTERTDARGEARFEALEHLEKVFPLDGLFPVFAIALPFRRPIEKPLIFEDEKLRDTLLQLPQHGEVEVRVAGEYPKSGVLVGLASEPTTDGLFHQLAQPGRIVLPLPEAGNNGVAILRFPIVGLGATLRAGLWAPGGFLFEGPAFAGPKRSGEEVVVTLEPVSAVSADGLKVRLLSDRGALAGVNAKVALSWTPPGKRSVTRSREHRIRSDAGGMIGLPLFLPRGATNRAISVEVIRGREHYQGRSSLPAGPAADLELFLEERAYLVGGVVEDPEGKGIERVELFVESQDAHGIFARLDPELWSFSNQRGVFFIRGKVPRRQWRLVARRAGWRLPETYGFRGIADDLRLRMIPAARVDVVLRLPKELNKGDLRLNFERRNEDGGGWTRAAPMIRLPVARSAEGRSSFMDLDSGRYRARVHAPFLGEKEPPIWEKEVSVVVGEREPTVIEGDLRPLMKTLRVTVPGSLPTFSAIHLRLRAPGRIVTKVVMARSGSQSVFYPAQNELVEVLLKVRDGGTFQGKVVDGKVNFNRR